MIKFSEIKKSEVTNLASLASDIWHEYWTCILSEEQINYMVDKFQSPKAITEQINNENYTYFYILYNQEKAGYIGLSQKDNYIFLSKIYIKKDYRHKGIGTNSFEFIKQYTKDNGYNKILLTVNKHNKNTIDAYHKWGFKITDAVITDIGNGFVMDDYIMEYKIER